MTTGDSERFKHGYRSIAEYLMADMASSRATPRAAALGSGLGGVTVEDFRRVQAAIAAGRWRASSQARGWAGVAVAAVLGLDPKADKTKIAALLKAWVASGMLVTVDGLDDRRERRSFIEVGTPADG